MKNIYIRNRVTGATIFSGTFPTLRHALESAVQQGVSLRHADLAGANLANATLDGADLRGADMSGVILVGANLTGADMAMACLCETRLVGVDFTDATFGGTLVTGAIIDTCAFTCASALTLPFIEARLGANTLTMGGRVMTFTAPPVVVTGLPARIAFLDTAVIVGDSAYPRENTPHDVIRTMDALCRHAGATARAH